MEERISALFGNEEFVAKFNALTSPEDIKALFGSYGVDLSDEELKSMIDEAVGQNEGELSADDLDNVNGGIFATLGAILAGTWSFAVKVYGSPEAAIAGIGTYWANKLMKKSKKKR